MATFYAIFKQTIRSGKPDYELIPSDSRSPRPRRRHYSFGFHPLGRRPTQRHVFLILFSVLVIFISAVLLNGGLPALYSDIRQLERNLPQHNLTYSQIADIRYIAFPSHIWGHGWNNVFQEYLLLSYLACITNRSFVFDDYVWSHLPLPYTLYDFALRPTRIPLNAFISGPTAGGHTGVSPRAVNVEFWESVCPPERRVAVKYLIPPSHLKGASLIAWWKRMIKENNDVKCLEIDTAGNMVFDFSFFAGEDLLDIWPFFSNSAILTQFGWSHLVHSAVERNLATLVGLRGAITTSLDQRSSNSRTLHLDMEPSSTSPVAENIPGLLSLHIRRGDFKRHCPRLAMKDIPFHGFNSFKELPDPWIPFNGTIYGNGSAERIEYYRKRCFPTQEEVVKRLHQIRDDYDTFALEMRVASNESVAELGTPGPIHRLRRTFVLTNASPKWLDGLKSKLKDDGWDDVIIGDDLVLDSEQRGVDVAVDMSIAEKAEVFVGNGFSSLSANVVMLRMAKGFDPWTNRLL